MMIVSMTPLTAALKAAFYPFVTAHIDNILFIASDDFSSPVGMIVDTF